MPEKFGNKNEVFAHTPKIYKAKLWLKCGLNCKPGGGQNGLNQNQGGGFEDFFFWQHCFFSAASILKTFLAAKRL